MRNMPTFQVSSGPFENYKDRGSIFMSSIGMHIDIASLIEATAAGNSDQITGIARELVQQGADASELTGRVGMVAAHGDREGHTILTLDAASMMCRWLITLRATFAAD